MKPISSSPLQWQSLQLPQTGELQWLSAHQRLNATMAFNDTVTAKRQMFTSSHTAHQHIMLHASDIMHQTSHAKHYYTTHQRVPTIQHAIRKKPLTSPIARSFCCSSMVLWCHGAMLPWCHGDMAPWRHGAIDERHATCTTCNIQHAIAPRNMQHAADIHDHATHLVTYLCIHDCTRHSHSIVLMMAVVAIIGNIKASYHVIIVRSEFVFIKVIFVVVIAFVIVAVVGS